MAAAFGVQFLTDLTLVVAVAAVATLLFERLRQPVVLGYLLAGILVGPHTPGPVVSSLESVQALAELGVIFLMFGIGLEFRLHRLGRAGLPALGAAGVQILAVILLTLLLGRVFGWSSTDALFLGAILAISSTVLAARAILEAGQQAERWADLALAILIVEDVVAVALLAVLSAGQEAAGVLDVVGVLGRMATFGLLVVVLGLLFLPRLVNRLVRREAEEVLVVLLAGLALAVAMLAMGLGLSPALGAFLAGAVVAEASEAHHAAARVLPLRDLFAAVFFVSIGMLLDPALLVRHWVPIVALAALLVVARVALYSVPAALLGARPRDAFRMSMAMGHIGEFSFVLAALGLALGVVSDFVLPVTVAVAALSAFWTPYLVRHSDRAYEALRGRVPPGLAAALAARRRARAAARAVRPERLGPEGRRLASRVAINAAATLVILAATQGVARALLELVTVRGLTDRTLALLPWLGGGLLALPFALDAARWAWRLAGRLGLARAGPSGGAAHPLPRAVAAGMVLGAALGMFGALVAAAPFLPPLPVLLFALAAYMGAALLLWERMARLHRRVEAVLEDALEGQPQGEGRLAVVDAVLHAYRPGLEVERVRLRPGTGAVEGTLRDLGLRGRTGVMVVAVQRGERVVVNPRSDFELDPGDVVVMLGDPDQLARARGLLLQKLAAPGPGEQAQVEEVPVEPGSALAGATLAESGLGARAGVTVLAVLRGRERHFNPPADLRVRDGDLLLLVGTPPGLEKARGLARAPPGPA